MAMEIQKRSGAESFGNHCSNDVLAANIAKSIVFGSDLVTPAFVAEKAHDIHPDDLDLFRTRIVGHITDLCVYYEGSNLIPDDDAVVDGRIRQFLSGVTVSEKAGRGGFIAPLDCPDDRGRWFADPEGNVRRSSFRNYAEDPLAPYGGLFHEVTDLDAARLLADRLTNAYGTQNVLFDEPHFLFNGGSRYEMTGISKRDGKHFAMFDMYGAVEFGRIPYQFDLVKGSTFLSSVCEALIGEINVRMSRGMKEDERGVMDESLGSDMILFKDGPEITFPDNVPYYMFPGDGSGTSRLAAVYRSPDGVTRVQLENSACMPLHMLSDKAVAVVAEACRRQMDLILDVRKDQAKGKARKNEVSM